MKIPLGDRDVELDDESIHNLVNYINVLAEIDEEQKRSNALRQATQSESGQSGKIPA
jgi:hypothetical protein